MVTKEIRVIDGVEREVTVEQLPTVVTRRDAKYCAQTIGGGVMTEVVFVEDDRSHWIRKAPVLPASGDVKPPEEL